MSRRGARRLENSEEPAVNLTPLIDVVFVILIIFILIAPLLELEKVELADGPYHDGRALPLGQSSSIAIHVRRDNTIWLNQQQVDLPELANQLRHLQKSHPKAVPQLFHDKHAYFGTYQAVKNAAEAAGFQQLEMVLQPSDKV